MIGTLALSSRATLRVWRAWLVSCSVLAALFAAGTSVAGTEDYIHSRLGMKYRGENKLDLAVEEYRKVLAAYPDNFNAYMQLAEIRDQQGLYRLAVHNLNKALAYNPGWGRAQKMLALMYEKDRQYYKARDILQDYREICDPEEQDSIDGAIDRLHGIIYGGTRPEGVDVGRLRPPTDAEEEGDLENTAAKAAASKPGGGVARSVPAAEEAFKQGVYYYKKGLEEGGGGDFDQALEYFRKALSHQPGHAGSYYYAGLIRRRRQQNQMAKVNFEKALSYPDLGYNAHFYLGKIYGEEGDYPKAMTHLREYIQRTDYEPGKREAQNLLDRFMQVHEARTRDTLRVDIQALGREDIHDEVSKIPPEAAYAPVELRIDSLLFMVVADTLSDVGRAMLEGVVAFRDGKYDRAVEVFRNVMVSFPKGNVAVQCIYNTGVCYVRLRNYSGAENQFSQVLSRFPSHGLAEQSLFLKALSYFERHESATAEKLFREFIGRHRDHRWVGKAYEKLGDCFVDLEQPRRAVDAYSQAVARAGSDHDRVHAYYKLGEAYAKIDNGRRALESYQKAIETGEKAGIYERVPDSYYRIADHYYRVKKFAEALKYYDAVTGKYKGYHDQAWGLFQLGGVYKNLGNYEKAIGAYERLMKEQKGNYWAEQAQWKLEDAIWEHQYRAVLR